jgi:hypothetical protein
MQKPKFQPFFENIELFLQEKRQELDAVYLPSIAEYQQLSSNVKVHICERYIPASNENVS